MVKNIIAGAICLFCMNMLLNVAAIMRLEREVKEQEQISSRSFYDRMVSTLRKHEAVFLDRPKRFRIYEKVSWQQASLHNLQ